MTDYIVEVHYPDISYLADRGGWLLLINDRLEYCRGYLRCRRELPLMHGAMRLVRCKDGRVMESIPACTEIGVGMVAGYPTGEQQLAAVRRTLSRVKRHGEYVSEEEAALAEAALRALDAKP